MCVCCRWLLRATERLKELKPQRLPVNLKTMMDLLVCPARHSTSTPQHAAEPAHDINSSVMVLHRAVADLRGPRA